MSGNNPHRTHGPGGDETWDQWFRRIRQEGSPVEQEEDGLDEGEIEIVVPGREAIDGDPVPDVVRKYYNFIIAKGWTAKLGYSQSFRRGKTFKSGDRVGEMSDDRILHQFWVDAHKAGKGLISIIYAMPEGKKPSCVARRINRQVHNYSDKEFREWITSEER